MNLFNVSKSGQNHQLFSGKQSHFRIDAEHFEEEDIENIAWLFAQTTSFGFVISIPRGGNMFADALRKLSTKESDTVLIVDDVLSTGKSMQSYYDLFSKDKEVKGVVLFSRGETPDWITAIFQLPKTFEAL